MSERAVMSTDRKGSEPLRLGPDVVQRLIPHRRPLVMVDAVLAYRHRPRPTLWARRQISANEDIFTGHFPGLHLWPGVFTIEGLGQSTLLCAIVAYLVDQRVERGGEPGEVYEALRRLERTATQPFATASDDAALGDTPAPRAGVAGQVDVKFLAPVYAGCALEYCVTLTHQVGALARFDVVAEVEGTPVARGTMTGMIGPPSP